MSVLRPGDVPPSLVDRPYDAALHLAKRIEALRREPSGEWRDEEVARLTEVVRELMERVKAEAQ